MQYQPHRARQGFTLFEVVVVLAILMGTAYAMLVLLKNRVQTESVATAIAAEANELNMLLSAANLYVSAHSTGWTPGALQTIPISAMITAGSLPAGFALRNGTVGTSPLFEPYTAMAMIATSDNKPRVVITTGADPQAARLSRYGLQLTVSDVQSLQQQIAEKAQLLINNAIGVIQSGATVVTGNYGAFSESIAPSFQPNGPPAYARPAVLYGFPDLVVPVITASTGSQYKACEIRQPKLPAYGSNGSPTNPTCQVGWTQLAQFPYCGTANYNFRPQYAVYGSAVGDITLNQRATQTTSQLVDTVWCYTMPQNGCTATYAQPPQPPGYYYNTSLYTSIYYSNDVLLNGAVVATDTGCTATGYAQSNTTAGGYCTSGGPYPCVYQTGGTSQGITGLNPGVDLLCCLPN